MQKRTFTIVLMSLVLGLVVLDTVPSRPAEGVSAARIRSFVVRNLGPTPDGQATIRVGILVKKKDLVRKILEADRHEKRFKAFTFLFSEQIDHKTPAELQSLARERNLSYLLVYDRRVGSLALYDPDSDLVRAHLLISEPPRSATESREPSSPSGGEKKPASTSGKKSETGTISWTQRLELKGKVHDFDFVRVNGTTVIGWVEGESFHAARYEGGTLRSHQTHRMVSQSRRLVNLDFVNGPRFPSGTIGVLVVSTGNLVESTFYEYDLVDRTLSEQWSASSVFISEVEDRFYAQSWRGMEYRHFDRVHPVTLDSGGWSYEPKQPSRPEGTFITGFRNGSFDRRSVIRLTSDGKLELAREKRVLVARSENLGNQSLEVPYFKNQKDARDYLDRMSTKHRERVQGLVKLPRRYPSSKLDFVLAVSNLKRTNQSGGGLLGNLFSSTPYRHFRLKAFVVGQDRIDKRFTSRLFNGYVTQLRRIQSGVWLSRFLSDRNVTVLNRLEINVP